MPTNLLPATAKAVAFICLSRSAVECGSEAAAVEFPPEGPSWRYRTRSCLWHNRKVERDVKIEGTNSASPLISTEVSKNELKTNPKRSAKVCSKHAKTTQLEPTSILGKQSHVCPPQRTVECGSEVAALQIRQKCGSWHHRTPWYVRHNWKVERDVKIEGTNSAGHLISIKASKNELKTNPKRNAKVCSNHSMIAQFECAGVLEEQSPTPLAAPRDYENTPSAELPFPSPHHLGKGEGVRG